MVDQAELKMRETLSIVPEELENEFIEAPEILAFFVETYAKAEKVHLVAKFVVEQTEARLMIRKREELNAAARAEFTRDRQIEDNNVHAAKAAGHSYKRVDIRYKAPTVAEVENGVIASDEYGAARMSYIAAECEAKRLKGWCDVSRVKRDMLTNLGMRVNAEMRGAGWTPNSGPDQTGPSFD